MQNRCVRDIVTELRVRCRFGLTNVGDVDADGCPAELALADIDAHEAACEYAMRSEIAAAIAEGEAAAAEHRRKVIAAEAGYAHRRWQRAADVGV